jgi:hypothetical protein
MILHSDSLTNAYDLICNYLLLESQKQRALWNFKYITYKKLMALISRFNFQFIQQLNSCLTLFHTSALCILQILLTRVFNESLLWLTYRANKNWSFPYRWTQFTISWHPQYQWFPTPKGIHHQLKTVVYAYCSLVIKDPSSFLMQTINKIQ